MKIQKLSEEYVQETIALINNSFSTKIKEDRLRDTMINPEKATYILIVNNEVVATVGIRENSRICWLCTKYKRRGYARKLMEHVIVIDSSYLLVKKNNLPAIELYKSLGFIVAGTKENSYLMEI